MTDQFIDSISFHSGSALERIVATDVDEMACAVEH